MSQRFVTAWCLALAITLATGLAFLPFMGKANAGSIGANINDLTLFLPQHVGSDRSGKKESTG